MILFFFQDQVSELEDHLDDLNADFSNLSKSTVDLDEEIKALEQEVTRQTELATKPQGALHAEQLKQTVAKLSAKRDERSKIELLKARTSEELEKCQIKLTDMQEHKLAKEAGVTPMSDPAPQTKPPAAKKGKKTR